jgi:2'-5' RNA ligase
MGGILTEPRRVYEELWRINRALLKSGRIKIDPRLRDKAGDFRRGITLVARPDAIVKKSVTSFLDEVTAICPRQHLYKPSELHMTVMAIISGSEFWRDKIDRLPASQRTLEQVLNQSHPFRVHFRGVTVSPNAVMIQGFPVDDALLQLRDEIRRAFGKAGLGGLLDRRYRTVTAHLTVMRFTELETDWKRLFDFLRKNRETDFGETFVTSLQLIRTNWYASAGFVRILQKYLLKN